MNYEAIVDGYPCRQLQPSLSESVAQPQLESSMSVKTNRLTIVREISGNHIAQAWIPNATASRFD